MSEIMAEEDLERLEQFLHPARNSRYSRRFTKTCPVCGKRFKAGEDWGYGVGRTDTCTWTCQRILERRTQRMPKRISPEDVKRIQSLRLEGKTIIEIEAETGISHSTICRCINRTRAPKAEKPKASEQEARPQEPETAPEIIAETAPEEEVTGMADSAKIARLAIESIEALARFATGGSGTAGIAHLIQLQTEIIREVLE